MVKSKGLKVIVAGILGAVLDMCNTGKAVEDIKDFCVKSLDMDGMKKLIEKEKRMVELELNYDELVEISLEDTKKIIREFDKESFLEDIAEEINGINYGIEVIDEGDWTGGGKYQHRTDIGVLCECDEEWNVVKMFDVAVTSQVRRSGSYFSEYNYDYENFEANKIIKKVIPQQIIPERTVVTLAD